MFPAEATVKQRLRAEFLAGNIQLHHVAVAAATIHRIVLPLLPALHQGVILHLLAVVQALWDLLQEVLVVAADLVAEAIVAEVVRVEAVVNS